MARGNQDKNRVAMSKSKQLKDSEDFHSKVQALLKSLVTFDGLESGKVAFHHRELIEKVKEIQDDHKRRNNVSELKLNSTHKEREKFISQLKTKLKQSGATGLDSINTCSQFGELGLEKVKNTDDLLKIPTSCSLTSRDEHFYKTADFNNFCKKDKMVKGMANVRLGLRLVYEKIFEKESKFKEYVASLPGSYSTPLYWKVEDFENLEKLGESCREELETSISFVRAIVRQYCYLLTVFYSQASLRTIYKHFTWDLYRWAVSTVQTRANEIQGDDEESVLGFIPFLELANTSISSQIGMERIHNSSNEVTHAVLDVRDVEVGQPVLISYGSQDRNGMNQLVHNGICEKTKVEYKVYLPQSKPLSEKKVKYMKSVGGEDFSSEAVLSPMISVQLNSSDKEKVYQIQQLCNFLTIALDKNDDSDSYDYQNPEMKSTAVRFLKIRLMVLNKSLQSTDCTTFSTKSLQRYFQTKQSISAKLLSLVDTI